MSELTKKFQEILKDIEDNISNEQEKEYINKKIAEVSLLYMEVIENMNEVIQSKINNIEKVQNSIENKVNKIQTSIAGIENDIYDEEYDFEIICPYCNTEFTADIESKSDIKCPECQNVIELDWNGEESECSGSCSSCSSHCSDSLFDEYDEDDEDEDDDEEDDEDM